MFPRISFIFQYQSNFVLKVRHIMTFFTIFLFLMLLELQAELTSAPRSKIESLEKLDETGRVTLSWDLSNNQTEITFQLWAQTTGFVGFGISPHGGMAGADIFIAGVYPNGTAYSFVRSYIKFI